MSHSVRKMRVRKDAFDVLGRRREKNAADAVYVTWPWCWEWERAALGNANRRRWRLAKRALRVDPERAERMRCTVEQLEALESWEWLTCTGCYEGGEYDGYAHWYPWSDAKGCRLGDGCEECKGVGAVPAVWPEPPEREAA